VWHTQLRDRNFSTVGPLLNQSAKRINAEYEARRCTHRERVCVCVGGWGVGGWGGGVSETGTDFVSVCVSLCLRLCVCVCVCV
jgi:hypothetical protein